MLSKALLGTGIFSWEREERVTDRYGFFGLYPETHEETETAEVEYDLSVAERFKRHRVRLTVEVLVARKSGHIGDMFHEIVPSQPEVGEVVDLGVGIFTFLLLPWYKRFSAKVPANRISVGLVPGDGRDELWIDPRKLYRLHDQTVRVFVEETKDDFTKVDLKAVPEGLEINFPVPDEKAFQAKSRS